MIEMTSSLVRKLIYVILIISIFMRLYFSSSTLNSQEIWWELTIIFYLAQSLISMIKTEKYKYGQYKIVLYLQYILLMVFYFSIFTTGLYLYRRSIEVSISLSGGLLILTYIGNLFVNKSNYIENNVFESEYFENVECEIRRKMHISNLRLCTSAVHNFYYALVSVFLVFLVVGIAEKSHLFSVNIALVISMCLVMFVGAIASLYLTRYSMIDTFATLGDFRDKKGRSYEDLMLMYSDYNMKVTDGIMLSIVSIFAISTNIFGSDKLIITTSSLTAFLAIYSLRDGLRKLFGEEI